MIDYKTDEVALFILKEVFFLTKKGRTRLNILLSGSDLLDPSPFSTMFDLLNEDGVVNRNIYPVGGLWVIFQPNEKSCWWTGNRGHR